MIGTYLVQLGHDLGAEAEKVDRLLDVVGDVDVEAVVDLELGLGGPDLRSPLLVCSSRGVRFSLPAYFRDQRDRRTGGRGVPLLDQVDTVRDGRVLHANLKGNVNEQE